MVAIVSSPVSEALAATGAFRINPAGVHESTHGSYSCGGSEDTVCVVSSRLYHQADMLTKGQRHIWLRVI